MERAKRKHIVEALWPAGLPGSMEVWVILDGARDDRIYGAVDGCYLHKCCLYSGDLPWQLQMTAPYLIQLHQDDQFMDYVIEHGWGHAWGIFLRSDNSMKNLRRHLRGFLLARDDSGRRLVFRYYDPRVLRNYLPTCWPEELRAFFGPVDSYVVEGENPSQVLDYRIENAALRARQAQLSVRGTSASA